jgi:hypothetical protein
LENFLLKTVKSLATKNQKMNAPPVATILCRLIVPAVLLMTPNFLFGGSDKVTEIPDVVTAAVAAAFPGFELQKAKLKKDDGVEVYKLEGTIDGSRAEVIIAIDGTLLEIEIKGKK